MEKKKYLYQKIGSTGYGKIKSIEIASDLLEKNCSELNDYEKVTPRYEGYYVPDHFKAISNKEYVSEDSNQAEKRIFRKAVIDNYGKYTIDYEVNICPGEKQNIDVLFFNDGCLYIGEGKGPKASGDESILRAVLEIETYSRLIDQERIFNDYCSNLKWLDNCIKNKSEIKKAIIIFEQKDSEVSPMYKQLITDNQYEPIRVLMRKLKVYAVKAEDFCENGKISFFDGFSPKDY